MTEPVKREDAPHPNYMSARESAIDEQAAEYGDFDDFDDYDDYDQGEDDV